MRFQVNEVLPVIALVHKSDRVGINFFFGAYLPWIPSRSVIERIEFEHLTVTEHHRVRSEWDEKEAEPKYDGYVLKSAKGEIWHNQYPYASYGQTSDASDRRFNRYCGGSDATRSWLDANPSGIAQYRSLSCYLQDLKRGIHTRRAEQFKPDSTHTVEDIHHTDLLELHLKAVVDQYESEHGKKITFTQHKYGEGENAKWLEGWYDVNFVEV